MVGTPVAWVAIVAAGVRVAKKKNRSPHLIGIIAAIVIPSLIEARRRAEESQALPVPVEVVP